MADSNENIAFTVKIDGIDKQIKGLKDLREAQRAAKDSFIGGNQDAAESLGILDKKLEDLNKTTNTFKSSGVENLTRSFGVLAEGFLKFDTGKISAGFKGIGAAMDAIPVFLLIQGLTLLIENFDAVVDAITNFTSNTESAKAAAVSLTDAINGESAALKDLISISQEHTKTELLRLQSLESSTEELDAARRKALFNELKYAKESEVAQVDRYNKLLANDQSTEEQVKSAGQKLQEIRDTISKKQSEIQDFQYQSQIALNKQADDLEKDRLAKQKEYLDKQKAAYEKNSKDLNALIAGRLDDEISLNDAAGKAIDDKQKQYEADKLAGDKLEADQLKQINADNVKDAQDVAAQIIANEKATSAAKTAIRKQEFASAKGLSDLFFAGELAGAQGNASRTNEIKKEQFNINKAWSIASLEIDGYNSAMAAYKSLVGIPVVGPGLAIAAAAASEIFTQIQAANIAATTFNGTSGGSASTGPSPGTGGSNIGSIPSPPPPPQISGGIAQQGTTIINSGGNNGQVYVLETQSSGVSKRVELLENRSKF